MLRWIVCAVVNMAYVALEAARPIEELPPPAVGEWVESKAAHLDAQIFRSGCRCYLRCGHGCTMALAFLLYLRISQQGSPLCWFVDSRCELGRAVAWATKRLDVLLLVYCSMKHIL